MKEKKIMSFDFNYDVILEKKSPSKVILLNKKTGNKTSLTDKTEIAIISEIRPKMPNNVEIIANRLGIDENIIKKLFKKLTERKFLIDNTEEYSTLE
jgi:predicted transcriptional regulator